MKNILIAVTGLTPQVVTETHFCLSVKKKIQIDEIYVVTTTKGRDVIYGIDTSPNTPETPLKREITAMCKMYKLKIPKFENNDIHVIVAREESVELSDIRTDRDNKLFPNKITEVIKTFCSNSDNVLYCSVSGGRKTMSVYLAYALSLFGRENDKLLHVLTSEEFEFKDFYPKNKRQSNTLELSEMPYVRLRYLLFGQDKQTLTKKKYSDIVKITQAELKKLTDINKLIINIPKKTITYGNNSVALEPLEFTLYYMLVDAVLSNKGKYDIHYLTSAEFGKNLRDKISEFFIYYHFDGDKKRKKWWEQGFDADVIRTKFTKLKEKIFSIFVDPDLAQPYLIDSEKIYGGTKYYLNADKNKIKVIYE